MRCCSSADVNAKFVTLFGFNSNIDDEISVVFTLRASTVVVFSRPVIVIAKELVSLRVVVLKSSC